MPSEAIENFLKAVFLLEQEGAVPSTSALADRLGVKPASVTGMMQKLARRSAPLIHYERHRGVTLTAKGREIALEVLRHHRLIETYLCEKMGYSWDEVHDEAEVLEHHISEKFEEKMDQELGYPKFDPHGAPIPTKDGEIPEAENAVPVLELEPGEVGRVLRILSSQADLLRYLAEFGLRPGAQVTLRKVTPFDGPVFLEIEMDGQTTTEGIGAHVARQVLVQKL